MSKVMRSVKNVTKGYSSTQVKVREATSNDAWGPSGTQMSEIAQLTFNGGSDFVDIMEMLDKRLNDKGKNWRHVLKALKVLDYCLHEGSIKVVSWAQANIYIIKTLREFQYMDEDGRDVVRVAAKELTSLLIDEERLTAERNDRRSWKSRVTGLDEYGPPTEPSRSRPQRYQGNDENDVEYRLAIEASKAQEEEDRRKREHQPASFDDDDDLAKAIQLSKEEEDRRRKELEQASAANNASLFDDDLIQIASTQKVQPTGFNMGYQQGQPVDFFANPVDQNQIQPQPTGYMPYAYTGFQNQPTGFFQNGYGMQQPNMPDMYQQQQNMAALQQPQPTGFNNPYALQVPSPQPEPPMPTGSNNPWATSNAGLMKPAPTGSNNPFSAPSGNTSNSPFNRPRTAQASGLGSLPEQNPIANFQSQPQTSQTQRDLSDHEQKLNALLAGGDGMDTFGNTGNLRIPAQHTAPGTFVNSAGSGINKLNADATGNNPFLRTQFTGMPSVQYPQSQAPNATGPVGYGTTQNNNPFAMRQQQSSTPQDLIQF
ncbi:putative enth domain-containing protein [Ceratocystis lukuohia]|uniref:Enth domain-containing protein n=1 Tax=Ceratocystis lukuohia TaxID=2019550 RepID=A0ABR4MIN7_9PEZI